MQTEWWLTLLFLDHAGEDCSLNKIVGSIRSLYSAHNLLRVINAANNGVRWQYQLYNANIGHLSNSRLCYRKSHRYSPMNFHVTVGPFSRLCGAETSLNEPWEILHQSFLLQKNFLRWWWGRRHAFICIHHLYYQLWSQQNCRLYILQNYEQITSVAKWGFMQEDSDLTIHMP